MISSLYSDFCRLYPGFRKKTRQYMYQFLARAYRKADWTFMNYGYASLDPESAPLILDETDEPDRYSIQLYHHVASPVSLAGKAVLEVGSGRGGGACYIHRYMQPRMMVGLDFSSQAVDFCVNTHCLDGLIFIAGDAERLPFAEEYFDAVINVESAHCYASMEAFLAQVWRVLRPGGYFLFADFRAREHVAELHQQLHRSGLTMLQRDEITANVIHARNLDNEMRLAFIRQAAPQWLVGLIGEFGGVQGSRIYKELDSGQVIYERSVLQKPA
jgi:SAM-dependent methyltransferase